MGHDGARKGHDRRQCERCSGLAGPRRPGMLSPRAALLWAFPQARAFAALSVSLREVRGITGGRVFRRSPRPAFAGREEAIEVLAGA